MAYTSILFLSKTAKIESSHAHTKSRVFISFARDDDNDVDEKLAFAVHINTQTENAFGKVDGAPSNTNFK